MPGLLCSVGHKLVREVVTAAEGREIGGRDTVDAAPLAGDELPTMDGTTDRALMHTNRFPRLLRGEEEIPVLSGVRCPVSGLAPLSPW